MGDSPREQETQQLLNEMKRFNPNVENLFSSYEQPFSTQDILKATDAYTKKGVGTVRKNTATQVNKAAKNVGKRFAGAGVGKGSIFEDAVAGAENKARTANAGVIDNLLMKQLSLVPGILEQGNKDKFAITSANQRVKFGNKSNQFNKFGGLSGLTQMLPDDTDFDSILEILNTAGGIADAIIPG